MKHKGSTPTNASEKLSADRRHICAVVRFAQGGPLADISRQRDLILYRIARGNGRPVPLPEVQQRVSDPQARVRDLRKLGCKITCETRKENGQRRSTYLLELNPDGSPAFSKGADVITDAPKEPKPERGSAWRNFSYGSKPPQPEQAEQPGLFKPAWAGDGFTSRESGTFARFERGQR